MKLHAKITKDGEVVALIHGPDAIDQKIKWNGRIWRFDFDRNSGPLWLRKDGEPRKNQDPPLPVWHAFDRWLKFWEESRKEKE